MSKILVLAEKPSVGRDLARVLGCSNMKNGYIEGEKYIVTWALGHLVTLAEPDKYDKLYANWNLDHLPILFDKAKFVVLKPTAKQYYTVEKLLARKDVNQLIIATDAGREGELVARLIINKARFNKPIKRLWISSVTDKAIKQGFNNLKPSKEYDSLFNAALARAEADWIMGINATRALTTKYNTSLSCGRVQTPTLYMIYLQDMKITNFKPIEYKIINVKSNELVFDYVGDDGSNRIFDFEKANNIFKSVENKKLEVLSTSKVSKKIRPKNLYDLTTLQREANSLYGFSAKKTLDVIQSLYEYHKIVTYPRTDSKYLTNDMKSTLSERVKASDIFNFEYKIDYNVIKFSNIIDDAKVSDHHAIIPTEQAANIASLNNEEQIIYKMIVQRFVSALMCDTIVENTTIVTKVDMHKFIAKGQTVKKLGWQSIYGRSVDNGDEYFQTITSMLQSGDTIENVKTTISSSFTKAPKALTESVLLGAMENPAKFVEDVHDKDTLTKTGGIGTVATRADIIEKLLNSFLIKRDGQALHITNKGKQLLEVVPIDLKSPTLTANWEDKLIKIENGKLSKNSFLIDVKKYTSNTIDSIKTNNYEFTHDNLTEMKCKKCQEKLLYVDTKNGKALVCSNIECKTRYNIEIPFKMKCPNCKKKLAITGTGFTKEAITCKSCSYRESIFNLAKKAVESNVANKYEVKKLLQKQKSEEVVGDNPFLNIFNKDK